MKGAVLKAPDQGSDWGRGADGPRSSDSFLACEAPVTAVEGKTGTTPSRRCWHPAERKRERAVKAEVNI